VIGAGRRLAIECDGEQFHGLEQLQNDLARQAVLERLGWTFVRIRGSVFYRDEERALTPVFKRLEELGIPPELKTGAGASAEARNEVVERVIREAEKLRAMWRSEPPADAPDPESDSNQRWHARGSSWTPPAGDAGEATKPLPAPITPTKQVLLNLVGSGMPTNASTGTAKPLGRFENEIISALRGRGRLETEPFVMELMKKLSLGPVERRQIHVAMNSLEARGAIRCGVNYVVLADAK
jgi:hypothetical protein